MVPRNEPASRADPPPGTARLLRAQALRRFEDREARGRSWGSFEGTGGGAEAAPQALPGSRRRFPLWPGWGRT